MINSLIILFGYILFVCYIAKCIVKIVVSCPVLCYLCGILNNLMI